ncbi:MAG: HDOD domain-containing protein [Methylomicrobium sp.]|nr:HDOD domain-containing protein [Methylomicrobium sp.]
MPLSSPLKLALPLNSVDQTLSEINGLISLPEIYQKIRQLMDDPKSEIDHFAVVVSSDPNLTATVLRVANSAFFGFPGKIDSINRAVNLLGVGQLHDMVLGTSAIASLDLPNDIMPLKTFWRLSLFSGVLTRLLASQLKIPRSERLFVIGLLHEIGHLVIYAKYPEQALQAIDHVLAGKQMLHVAEHQLLGQHYGEIGARLMDQWHLPANFQEIVHFQPTPSQAQSYSMETALLHIAHGYAQQVICKSDQALDQLIVPDAWKVLDLTPDQVESTLDNAQTVCSDMEKLMLN